MTAPDDELLARAELRVGGVLAGKYHVERVLGVGGMASVYAAVHRNGRRVAIKVLHPELSIRSDIRERFRRESQAPNTVDHPGVVAIIDDDLAEDGSAFLVMECLAEDGSAFLVMECLAGRSVEELWERSGERLEPKLVLAIAGQTCEVLAVAHRAGIIHRDIKPANLFVTSDGRLKVLDFGIARVRDIAATALTSTGDVLGTPAFMGPEQAAGKLSAIDARTDVWAVGATMFTLLTGRLVHQGETAQHLAILAATEPARSIATMLPSLAPEIVAIVDRALMRERSDRWHSADSMREAIGEASLSLFGEESIPLPTHASNDDDATLDDGRAVEGAMRAIGSTTSPVSSAASTRPQGVAQIANRMTWQLAATLASAFATARGAVRRDRHKRADAVGPRRPVPAVRIAAFVASALAVVVSIGLARNRFPAAGSGATAATSPTPASIALDGSSSAEVRSSETTGSASFSSTAVRAGAVPTATPHDAASARPPARSSPHLTPGAVPRRPGLTAEAPPALGKPECKPPNDRYVDDNGKTVWKRECFR